MSSATVTRDGERKTPWGVIIVIGLMVLISLGSLITAMIYGANP